MLVQIQPSGEVVSLAQSALPEEGAYTTFRTYGGNRILYLDKHIERLDQSARLQGREVLGTRAAGLRLGLDTILEPSGARDVRVRLLWSPPALIVQTWPFDPLSPSSYAVGVRCASVPVRRANPHAKDARFIATAERAYAGLPEGVHEGLMFDPDDDALLEGLSSNFFGLLEGELRTEGERVLAGVTRDTVLDLARPLIPVRFEAPQRGDLERLSEAFITSVSRGVLPVVDIDGHTIGSGQPGPMALELGRRLQARADADARPPLAG